MLGGRIVPYPVQQRRQVNHQAGEGEVSFELVESGASGHCMDKRLSVCYLSSGRSKRTIRLADTGDILELSYAPLTATRSSYFCGCPKALTLFTAMPVREEGTKLKCRDGADSSSVAFLVGWHGRGMQAIPSRAKSKFLMLAKGQTETLAMRVRTGTVLPANPEHAV